MIVQTMISWTVAFRTPSTSEVNDKRSLNKGFLEFSIEPLYASADVNKEEELLTSSQSRCVAYNNVEEKQEHIREDIESNRY